MSYGTEQDMQQARKLVENYNQLSNETRDKLANGVEWLAFLQNMAKGDDDSDAPKISAQLAV